jgi:hypothetical protein
MPRLPSTSDFLPIKHNLHRPSKSSPPLQPPSRSSLPTPPALCPQILQPHELQSDFLPITAQPVSLPVQSFNRSRGTRFSRRKMELCSRQPPGERSVAAGSSSSLTTPFEGRDEVRFGLRCLVGMRLLGTYKIGLYFEDLSCMYN